LGTIAWAALTGSGAVLLLGLEPRPWGPPATGGASAPGRLLPIALLALGICLPLGEGAAYVGALLVGVVLVAEGGPLRWAPPNRGWGLLALGWLVGGFVSLMWVDVGWLRPREIGRL